MTSDRQRNTILARLLVVYSEFIAFTTAIAMATAECSEATDNFDEQEGSLRSVTIQPYQFEPRRNSDEAESGDDSMSGEEALGSEEENRNPRLENSDWYVAVFLIDIFIVILSVNIYY